MRKITGIFSFLFFSLCCYAQSKMPSAAAVIKAACTQAKKENKNVLLIFQASWCGWCRKMDTALLDKSIQPLVDANYITTHLTVYESKTRKDLENPGALEFLTKHGGADKGIPYWLVLDQDGHLLADSQYQPGKNSGCPATEAEVVYFIGVLKKTSGLNDEELKVIEKRFRSNEGRMSGIGKGS